MPSCKCIIKPLSDINPSDRDITDAYLSPIKEAEESNNILTMKINLSANKLEMHWSNVSTFAKGQ